MDITDIRFRKEREGLYQCAKFELFQYGVKIVEFIVDKELHSSSDTSVCFNAWDGYLGITKGGFSDDGHRVPEGLLLFEHSEHERGHMKIFIKDPDGHFWNYVSSVSHGLSKADFM